VDGDLIRRVEVGDLAPAHVVGVRADAVALLDDAGERDDPAA
jgi:hypothetical protein